MHQPFTYITHINQSNHKHTLTTPTTLLTSNNQTINMHQPHLAGTNPTLNTNINKPI